MQLLLEERTCVWHKRTFETVISEKETPLKIEITGSHFAPLVNKIHIIRYQNNNNNLE